MRKGGILHLTVSKVYRERKQEGATDQEIARDLGVTRQTLFRWRKVGFI